MPKRIQLSRKAGWCKPPDAVVVARPSKWGNPYALGKTLVRMPATDGSDYEVEGRLHKTPGEQHTFSHTDGHITWHQVEYATAAQVVELYRRAVLAEHGRYPGLPRLDEVRAELRGKDLCCWCPPDQPCHADVLLQLANPVGQP
ncbi:MULTISPECIES: DUF4326 domain-containing protein [Nocardia]|uniref:DUF4326 domain-containing protein n=1 Tax=Nocardia TaxID=1817 RepID=UPI002454DF10|nr:MULTISPECIES: DUF4326 domain-containing protein [Nocardia]